ncbi:MAG: DMT family transporter [Synergistaceae bacterium]|jgi:O-acetylserine/cysteine efflux transporter|nr:DMT family transporter [Synergistaceae bacterium]
MELTGWIKGALLVLFGAFLWGTLVVSTKGATHLDPLTIAVMRSGMAALGCFAWFGLRNPRLLRVGSRRSLFGLFLYGGATCAFMYGGFTVALRVLSVAACEVIFYTFPLFTTFIGVFALRERPTAAQSLACVLIVAGVFLMTSLTGPGESSAAADLPLWGVAGAVLSMTGMTIQSLVGRRNAQMGWIPVETLFSYAQLFGFLWLALCKSATGDWSDIAGISPASWLLLGYMGFVTTLMGYGAYNLGLRYVSAATASMLASFEMVTAVVLAALVLGNVPTRGEVAGCLVILAALALGTRGAASGGAASDLTGRKEPV